MLSSPRMRGSTLQFPATLQCRLTSHIALQRVPLVAFMRIASLATLVATLLLTACAALGPPSLSLSRGEIAERAFIDRRDIDTRRIFRNIDKLAISGPDVSFHTVAQRLELGWTAKLADGPMGIPLSLVVSISGTPVLNAQNNGVDLTDVRIEDVRMPSIPFLNFGEGQAQRRGESLGTMPLLQFRPEELTRDGIAYAPTTLELGTFGLRVGLQPK